MSLARPLRIVVPGGTGRVGLLIARNFHEQGHAVSTVSRFPKPRRWEAIHWDAQTMGDWASAFEDADAVINFSGNPGLVAKAISACRLPPRVWLNASTTIVYSDSADREIEEGGALVSIRKALALEASVLSFATPQTRRVIVRLAPIMSPEFGAFKIFLRMVRCGLGGRIGSGEQYVDWIHDFDFIRAIEFLIERQEIEGPVNLTSPYPMQNSQFMCNLRRAWCTSYFGVPTPRWLVKVVCLAARIEPDLVLKSTRAVPRKLLDAGFQFHFPEWRGACENLVHRWCQLHETKTASIP